MAEVEGGRKEEGSRKEVRRERGEEKIKEKVKERKKDRSMKNSRRVGDLGRERRSSKVRDKDKKVGSRKIP